MGDYYRVTKYCSICNKRVPHGHECRAEDWTTRELNKVLDEHEAAGDVLDALRRTVVIHYADGDVRVVRITD